MNLTEYRREIDQAHRDFRAALEEHSAVLQKRLEVARMQFLGDDEKAVHVEPENIVRYRERD